MKSKNLLGLGIALFCLSACKKDKSAVGPPVEKIDKTEMVLDSTSYVLDGKLYTEAKYSSGWRVENLQSNAKVDSIINHAYYISGDKDSVMYAKTFTFYDSGPIINFVFIKKFNKRELINGFLHQPNDLKGFYSVGARNYAFDYGRDNTQNGIAISINNPTFKTYGSDSFGAPPTLNADAHKNSKFEIISLKKSKSGIYTLEAKFNTTLFNDNNESKAITNGYLKINLGLLDDK